MLLVCAFLAMLPASVLRVNDWVELGRDQFALEMLGPLAVFAVWWVMGWRTPRRGTRHNGLRALAAVALLTALGLLALTQFLLGWIPGPLALARTLINERSLAGVWEQIAAVWAAAGGRLALWWGGVRGGGASQDNLIFAGLAGIVLWTAGSVTGWLARRYQQGFLAAAPVLWLLGIVLLYSFGGRILMAVGLGAAVLLQLLLDHDKLLKRWTARGLDYSTGLLLDRLMLVIGVVLLLLTAAAVMPNLYLSPLVDRYFARVQPVYESMEGLADRLFPGVQGASRLRGGGLAGGLPNDFLLRGGPDLGNEVVMRVRMSDSPASGYPDYDAGGESPLGHYMRGGTLTVYDGRGWSNSAATTRIDVPADETLQELGVEGRKEVVQSVALTFNTQVLYAAPEPATVSTASSAGLRAEGDLVALWAKERSYTAVSAVPAVNDEMLAAEEAWSAQRPLPAGYEIHLELPDTITPRTRELAAKLTAGLSGPFAQAQAIEAYLRTFEYDLSVSEPPPEVTDVADYFLFELQRGYCDYYATAFVVLARLNGLPARFATGFAVGQWDPGDGVWTITEAEAHSWPEVYFPTYGWIPFEPTAGRPSLARIGLPQTTLVAPLPAPVDAPEVESPPVVWNWQMLIWFAPLALLGWALYAVAAAQRRKREDPWLGVMRWGARAGRPMAADETVLEYGGGLADYVLRRQTQQLDAARKAAAEMRSLSGAVNSSKYASPAQREDADSAVRRHWERLRDYLRVLRIRK